MNFKDFFRNINIPVIIYREDECKTVVYENRSAIIQFNPLAKNQSWEYIDSNTPITSLLKLSGDDFANFLSALDESDGDVTNFNTMIQLYSGESTPVTIAANRLRIDEISYVEIFVYAMRSEYTTPTHALAAALEVAHKANSTDESIDNILAFAGNYINVSRSYIFESISDTLTSNTYEWCAPGIDPMINELQNLPKEAYSYDNIIEHGLAITDDIRNLPVPDRAILEPQGIKSLAIIPINYRGVTFGYVGFDDCSHYRKWSSDEIHFLQSLADMLAAQVERRNSEYTVRYSLDVLNIVTDTTDNMIFVIDLVGRFLFANSAVARAVKMPSNNFMRKNAKRILERWAGPLSNDDFSQLLINANLHKDKTNSWEFYNRKNGKWYLIRSSIIKWINGKDVYLIYLTEITGQKEYEARLEYAASTDMMTGLYNREWARQLLQNILDHKGSLCENSLVFIDLDALKKTNDKYGHSVGDAMILRTIELISMRIRKSDALCRWGGDEFVLITRADEKQTLSQIKDIQTLIDQHNKSQKDVYTVSFSYGIVGINANSKQTVDSLIQEADKKMYANKVRNEG